MIEFLKKNGIINSISFFILAIIKIQLCFIVLGSLFIFIGIKSIIAQKHLKKNGVKTLGKIIQYETDDEGYKTPIIQYSTITGEEITGKSSIYSATDASKLRSYSGNILKETIILYDLSNPKEYIIESETSFNIIVSVIFGLAGLTFIVLSILALTGHIK